MTDRFIAICNELGQWNIIDCETGSNKCILQLSNYKLAKTVCDDLNSQVSIIPSVDHYSEIQGRRDNMSAISDLDYEI